MKHATNDDDYNEHTIMIGDKTFEELADFYKDDPDGFLAWRDSILEAEIAKAPKESQQRLRGLLWRQEMRLLKYKDNSIMRYNAACADFFAIAREYSSRFEKDMEELNRIMLAL